jgi:hypothetical protein
VLETASLNQAQLAEYCRRKGLFIEQIAAWREACQQAIAHTVERTRERRQLSKNDRKRIKELEKNYYVKREHWPKPPPLLFSEKKPRRSGGARGRLIGTPDRQLIKALIEDAMGSGCRCVLACEKLEISIRTYQCWTRDRHTNGDRRKNAKRAAPANMVSEPECARIMMVANIAEFASLPSSQIVPALADQKQYLASESSFYRC